LEFPSPFQLVECFAHFSVGGTKKGKPNFECGMGAALQLCVCVCDGVFVGGALEGACVLLGKCQKPLVKKPYGNYSTQLNMKCGDGKRRECGGKKNKKKGVQRWANNEKYTHISIFGCLHSGTHQYTQQQTLLHPFHVLPLLLVLLLLLRTCCRLAIFR